MSTFSTDLHSAFIHALPAGSSADEVALFRSLQRAFAIVGQTYYVEEYHGRRSRVRFNPTRPWRPQAGHCELSDLLLITYQRRPHVEARFTFLQCKRDSSAAHHSLVAGGSTRRASYEQWDLLRNRPFIVPVESVRPPADVLRNAVLPSVGSFGIFTRGNPGWDMVYVSADQLTPVPGRVKHNGRLFIDPNCQRSRTLAGWRETLLTCCLPVFADELESVSVGTPVFSSPQSTQAWLAGVLHTVAASNASPTAVSISGELASIISGRLDGATAQFGTAAPNTVVLAVDDGVVPLLRAKSRG